MIQKFKFNSLFLCKVCLILLILKTLIILSGCSSTPPSGITNETASSSEDLEYALIEDFNTRNDKSEIPLSIWTTYNDIGNGGNSSIKPRGDLYPNSPDYIDTTGLFKDSMPASMKFEYKLVKDQFKWDPFVGLSLNFKAENVQADSEKIAGIQFWTKGSAMTIVARLSTVTDYANYQIVIPASEEWHLVQIPFEYLKQPSWGQPVPWDFQALVNLDWMLTGADGKSGSLELDQISWMAIGEYREPEPEIKSDYFEQPWVPNKDTNSYLENPQSGITQVMPYYQGYQGAYALTFDDGLASHFRELKPILDQHQLKATFYLISHQLGDSLNPPTWRFGTWEQFLQLAGEGHELAGHDGDDLTKYQLGSHTAPNTAQFQLATSRINIEKRIPGYQVINYAYPMTAHNTEIQEASAKFYTSLRAGNPAHAMSPQASDVPWQALHSRVISFPQERNEVNDAMVLEEIKSWIDTEVIQAGKWHLFTAHDVLPLDSILAGDPGYFSISKRWMNDFAAYLAQKKSEKKLWVTTQQNIVKYIKEREVLTWGVISENENEIVLNLKDTLLDSVYNHPLTLEIQVPIEWKQVKISQSEMSSSITAIEGKVTVDLIPDGGLIYLVNSKDSNDQ